MKKILFVLLTLSFVLASCNDDDDKGTITINTYNATVNAGETYQIEATSTLPISYTSDKPFLATASATGLINAKRIGTIHFTLTDGESTEIFTLTVEPRSTFYKEPELTFGEKMQSMIDRLEYIGPVYHNTQDSIDMIYIQYPNASPSYDVAYFFDRESGELIASGTYINSNNKSELESFLKERYLLAEIAEDNSYYYINNSTPETATMSIYTDATEGAKGSVLTIVYQPLTPTETTSASQLRAIKEKHSKATISDYLKRK